MAEDQRSFERLCAAGWKEGWVLDAALWSRRAAAEWALPLASAATGTRHLAPARVVGQGTYAIAERQDGDVKLLYK